MKKSACTILLYMIFGLLICSQSAQMISNTDISEVGQLTISSAVHVSDVDAAHITTPASLSHNLSMKANSNHPLILDWKNWIVPAFTYYFAPFLSQNESAGFIDIRKYTSNYLP